MPEAVVPPALQFVLKVASRCNLNCSYCYVYNKGDESWRGRPRFMSAETLANALDRIRRHCQASRQDEVRITFHGGEPCLMGPLRFEQFCNTVYSTLSEICSVKLSLQTNGTLIDERWAEILARHEVSVGLSLDGPEAINDAMRVDFRGRGTHAEIVHGLSLLRAAGLNVQILSVIHFGVDGLQVHRHLLDLGATRINYLFPDFTHDQVHEVFAEYGKTPCADYLLPVLDDWWAAGSPDIRVSPFNDMARVILGGETYIDLIGNRPYQYCFVETDGGIEGLDVLRICGQGLPATTLNVRSADFMAIAERNALHRKIMFEGPSLPSPCRACPERDTCGGGYLPHRYSIDRGFDNSSVWCRDLLLLFGRLREHMDVLPEETLRRRAQLSVTPVAAASLSPTDGKPAPASARPGLAGIAGSSNGGGAGVDVEVSLTEIPPVLTWLEGERVSAALHEAWRHRAAASLHRFLSKAAEIDAGAVERCKTHLRALDEETLARFLLAPETTFRIVWRRSSSMREALAFIERALEAERARLGRPVTPGSPAWSALGDIAVTEEGHVHTAPTVDGLPPLDFDSPFACHLDLSGVDYIVEQPRLPLTGEDREHVLRRLKAVGAGLEATVRSVASFVRTFTKILILQADDREGFSSGSNGDYVGRSAIANPHSDHIDECDLADAIVHESIHGLLYMHEAGRHWVTREELYAPTPRLVSPWSGTVLPVRPFLQACFVWYGLANFWAHAMLRESFPHARCKTLLARAAGGFLSKPLTARFDAIRQGLTDDVVAAITAMQAHIRTVFEEAR